MILRSTIFSHSERSSPLVSNSGLHRPSSAFSSEFLGRIDHQVKIRGFRVELSEIESFLTKQPGVRESVVVAIDGPSGDRYLVGYVVPAEDFAPSAHDLKNALGAKLPDYMVPSALVFLDALPLNSNRKVDYKRLPAPDRAERAAMAG